MSSAVSRNATGRIRTRCHAHGRREVLTGLGMAGLATRTEQANARQTDGPRVLVLGATGRCGAACVAALRARGAHVVAVVRPGAALAQEVEAVEYAEVSELDATGMARLLDGCDACVCMLGHRLTRDGVFGEPRRLVANATRAVCGAAPTTPRPLRFVLLSTAGVDAPDGSDEGVRGWVERAFIGALAAALPPYADSVEATSVATSEACAGVETVVVRPDDLLEGVAPPEGYLALPRLTNGIFDAKTTHIANVGAFVADLLTTDDATWSSWAGRSPFLVDGTWA